MSELKMETRSLPKTGPSQYIKQYSRYVWPLQGNWIERARAGLKTAPEILPPAQKRTIHLERCIDAP